MILCIDIGNTNIALGVYGEDGIVCRARLATARERTSDQYTAELCALFNLKSVSLSELDGVIIGSVVPELTDVIKRTAKALTGVDALTVGPGLKGGMRIKTDDPAELGADLYAGAIAAAAKYPLPCLIIDLGTATKISVVNENGEFDGCAIAAGVKMSLRSLAGGTSQLPAIDLTKKPILPYGKNTTDSMLAGIVGGTACMIDGLCEKIVSGLSGGSPSIVATGGQCRSVLPHLHCKPLYDPDLVLDGLHIIYLKNRK
ncbi:MAG: type III pantothenate kinase [Clostridia bacterium]|nr:type III pantothenate kinase [Clostridia bacterium]